MFRYIYALAIHLTSQNGEILTNLVNIVTHNLLLFSYIFFLRRRNAAHHPCTTKFCLLADLATGATAQLAAETLLHQMMQTVAQSINGNAVDHLAGKGKAQKHLGLFT